MGKMTIGKTAAQAGVGVETIRFYEREGLIRQPPKPGGGGYRIYPDEVVGRVRFIRRAQESGFSLREVKELLALRADPDAECADVRERAREKHEEVRRKISQLEDMKSALERLILACPGEGAVERCSIIESFEFNEVKPGRGDER